MICDIVTPSACEKSRTETPDSTVTGPVGGDDLALGLRRAIALAIAGTLALARAGTTGAAVDDDAAPPVSGASTTSWSDWSTAWQDLRLSSRLEPQV